MMTIQKKSMPSLTLVLPALQGSLDMPITQASDTSASQLIGQVFESATVAERGRLLKHLFKPLGLLSLAAVANGVFFAMLFRSGSQTLEIGLDETQNVRVDDVVALVEYVSQVSVESVESLVHLLSTCSLMAGLAERGCTQSSD